MPKQIRTATKLQWLYNSSVAEIKILKDRFKEKVQSTKEKTNVSMFILVYGFDW